MFSAWYIHAASKNAKELISGSPPSRYRSQKREVSSPLAAAKLPKSDARARDAVECHREDWSSVLRDKNLFSIMSEDTFLVRHRRASGLSELRRAQTLL